MHKFPILALAALACSAVAVAPAEARKVGAGKGKQPNIVVIMTDDQAAADLVHMPNVKKLLTDRGTSFSDAVDSFPLCCPARATFLTGQYAHTNGIIDNTARPSHDLPVFPRELQRAGYATGFYGKWHMGNSGGPRPGYDRWVSFPGHGSIIDPIGSFSLITRSSGFV